MTVVHETIRTFCYFASVSDLLLLLTRLFNFSTHKLSNSLLARLTNHYKDPYKTVSRVNPCEEGPEEERVERKGRGNGPGSGAPVVKWAQGPI